MSSEHSAAKVGEIFNKAGAAFTHLGELCMQVYTVTEDFREYERSQMDNTSRESTYVSETATTTRRDTQAGDSFDYSEDVTVEQEALSSSPEARLNKSNVSEHEVGVVGLSDR